MGYAGHYDLMLMLVKSLMGTRIPAPPTRKILSTKVKWSQGYFPPAQLLDYNFQMFHLSFSFIRHHDEEIQLAPKANHPFAGLT